MAKKDANPKAQDFLFRDLSYKPGTTIVEESQSLKLALECKRNGYTVFVDESDEMRVVLEKLYPNVFQYVSNVNEEEYIIIDNSLRLFDQ